MFRRTIMFAIPVCAVALAAAACGSSSGSPTATGQQSPAATPTRSSAVTQTPGAGGGVLGATATPPIVISAKNIKFDKSQLVATAGTIKIEFDNNDTSVAHNFAVFKSASDTSKPLGATPITSGPDKQTLTITLTPGQYYFECQVHPTQMHGTLVVH